MRRLLLLLLQVIQLHAFALPSWSQAAQTSAAGHLDVRHSCSMPLTMHSQGPENIDDFLLNQAPPVAQGFEISPELAVLPRGHHSGGWCLRRCQLGMRRCSLGGLLVLCLGALEHRRSIRTRLYFCATLFVGIVLTGLTSNISRRTLASVASSGFSSFRYESTSACTQTFAASLASADSCRHSMHSPLQFPVIWDHDI